MVSAAAKTSGTGRDSGTGWLCGGRALGPQGAAAQEASCGWFRGGEACALLHEAEPSQHHQCLSAHPASSKGVLQPCTPYSRAPRCSPATPCTGGGLASPLTPLRPALVLSSHPQPCPWDGADAAMGQPSGQGWGCSSRGNLSPVLQGHAFPGGNPKGDASPWACEQVKPQFPPSLGAP